MKFRIAALTMMLATGLLTSGAYAQTTVPTTHAEKKAAKAQDKADKASSVAQAKADKKKTKAQGDADNKKADADLNSAKKQ
jgi:hypothetical protein